MARAKQARCLRYQSGVRFRGTACRKPFSRLASWQESPLFPPLNRQANRVGDALLEHAQGTCREAITPIPEALPTHMVKPQCCQGRNAWQLRMRGQGAGRSSAGTQAAAANAERKRAELAALGRACQAVDAEFHARHALVRHQLRYLVEAGALSAIEKVARPGTLHRLSLRPQFE